MTQDEFNNLKIGDIVWTTITPYNSYITVWTESKDILYKFKYRLTPYRVQIMGRMSSDIVIAFGDVDFEEHNDNCKPQLEIEKSCRDRMVMSHPERLNLMRDDCFFSKEGCLINCLNENLRLIDKLKLEIKDWEKEIKIEKETLELINKKRD